MYLLDKVCATYDIEPDKLQVPTDPRFGYMLDLGDIALYGYVVPNIWDGENCFVFAYDSFVTHNHRYLSVSKLTVDFKSPALDIKLDLSIQEITARIQTNKRLFTRMFPSVDITTHPITQAWLDETMYMKRQKYATANTSHEYYLGRNGYRGYLTIGAVDNIELFRLIWYTNGPDYCGTHIVVTTDFEMKRKYSPYVLGHYWLIHYAKYNLGNVVRFSAFYPYKAIFGVEPTMYPTLSLENLAQLNPIPLPNYF